MTRDGSGSTTPRFSSSIASKRAFNKVISSSILIPVGEFSSTLLLIECLAGVSEYTGAGVWHGDCPICGMLALYAALFSGK